MANTNLREISEDGPAWATTLRRSIADLERRIKQAERDMPGSEHDSIPSESASATTRMSGARQRGVDRDLENGIVHLTTSGQRRQPTEADRDFQSGRMQLNSSGQRRMEAEVRELRAMLARLQRQATPEERNQLADAYHRADAIFMKFGYQTPAPMPGESPTAYRHRLADGLKRHSPMLSRTNMDALRDDAFGAVEARIYQDATRAAKTGIGSAPMTLHPHEHSEGGHVVTEYFGDNRAWMAPFMTGGTKLKINRTPGKVA